MSRSKVKRKAVIELSDKLIEACDGYDVDIVDFVLTGLLADVTVSFANGSNVEDEKRRVVRNLERFIDNAVDRGDESLN
jgi:hypothetical protein